MADVISKGTLFDPVLVKELFDKVKGKSSLAARVLPLLSLSLW